MFNDKHQLSVGVLKNYKQTSRELKLFSNDLKNKILNRLKFKIQQNEDNLLRENEKDVLDFKNSEKYTSALEDRLKLNPSRIGAMVKSIEEIIALENPIGQVVRQQKNHHGLKMNLVRENFGIILFIFEARPNVITEAFSLGFKSGNFLILKNGKEVLHTAQFIYQLIQECFIEEGFKKEYFCGLAKSSHEDVHWLLQQDTLIDLVIPRGGEKLVHTIKNNSRIAVIQNDRGLCHLFVDKSADLAQALRILINGKTQRPSVCNSIETLLVHEDIAEKFIPLAYESLKKWQVKWWMCPKSLILAISLSEEDDIFSASEESFSTEYLDLKINLKLVKNISEAIDHITRFGSKHSEVIVTEDKDSAQKFQQEVDAAVIYWNASSRFTDGFEFGFGGEMGISTQKLHVRGPMGLEALTTLKWVIEGTGQIRE